MIDIIPFEEKHLPGAVALSQAEDWPHRLEDWATMLRLSKGAIALSDGRVVGCGLCTPLGDVATLSLIIVDRAMRGQRLGSKIVTRLMELGDGRELRLTANPNAEGVYRRAGFVPIAKTSQFQGMTPEDIARPSAPVQFSTDWRALAELDTQALGADRRGMFEAMAADGARFAVLSDTAGAPQAFAMERRFGQGTVIGPVVAETRDQAETLIQTWLAEHAGGFCRVDIRDEHGMGPWLESFGLIQVGNRNIMSTRPENHATTPDGPKTFALVSQAFG